MNSSPPESFRVFVAIRLPEAIRELVRDLQSDLQRALKASQIRWTSAEQWHLTLKFLGEVPATQIESLTQFLQQQAGGFGSLALQAGKLGVFPKVQSPRVLWIGVEDSTGRLPQLHALIEKAARGFSAEPDEEHYRGHITLGRVKSWNRLDAPALHSAMKTGCERTEKWAADAAEVMRSELLLSGAQYVSLAQIPLGSGT